MRPFLALAGALSAVWVALPGAAQQIRIEGADVTVHGRVHVQLATSSVEGAVADMIVRRARLTVDIGVSDFIDARIQPDFAGGRATLEDAWVRFSLDPRLRVSVGQFKRPFSTWDLLSTVDLPVVERDGRIQGVDDCPGVGGLCSFSRLTEELAFDGRDTGIRLEGDLGRGLGYAATVTTGQGSNTSEVNGGKSLSGRLLYARGRWALGGFLALHDHPGLLSEHTPDTEYAGAGGADVEWGTWRTGFHLLASAARGGNWKVGPGTSFTALQVLASRYLPVGAPRLAGIEPLLRVSWSDADGDVGEAGGTLLTPGLMVYFSGRNGVSANVDVYRPAGAGGSEWSFKARTYLYF